LKDAQKETDWLDQCARSTSQYDARGKKTDLSNATVSLLSLSRIRKKKCSRTFIIISAVGYATLIRNYVDFLHSKLRYHGNHPEFNGTFDYKEYISLKGIDDPNEG